MTGLHIAQIIIAIDAFFALVTLIVLLFVKRETSLDDVAIRNLAAAWAGIAIVAVGSAVIHYIGVLQPG